MNKRLVAIDGAAPAGEKLPAVVKTEVESVLSESGTVGEAVALAVTADIAGRDMLEGDDPRVPKPGDADAFRVLDRWGATAFEVDSSSDTKIGPTKIRHTTGGSKKSLRVLDAEDNLAFEVRKDGTVFVGEFSDDSAGGGASYTDTVVYDAQAGVAWSPPPIFRYIDERPDLVVWDHFRRKDTTVANSTGLGVSDCSSFWHDSTLTIQAGAARATGAGGRRFGALMCPVRDVRVKCLVSVGSTHDFGIAACLRSASTWSSDDYLWARFRKTGTGTGDQVSIMLGTTVLGSGDADFGFTGDTDLICEIQVDDDTVTAYVDGQQAATATLDSTDMSTLAGRSDVGLTMNLSSDEDAATRIGYIEVSRVHMRRSWAFPYMFAHRATIRGQAENSFRTLPHLPPDVPGVEIDARLTSDGHFVMMHDATINRTTDSTGSVASMTLAELKAVNLDGGGKIPLLSDWLESCEATHLDYILCHCKSANIAELVALIEASPVSDRCILFGDTVSDLTTARSASETIRLALSGVTVENADTVIPAAEALDVEMCFLAPNSLSDGTLAAVPDILSAGMIAGASVENDSENLNAAIDAGVTALISDYPTIPNR
ncbi:glycerophosphodiester phosphodiesterase family protein [Mycolicibacterium pulveris]|uniref:GP-PDE domain-containing protein n=1 Tax=Mycolicibacterium pulveris TaxID=36813 RepID=A0A7I7UCR4_MYCPV|nr:glycerophosphodiester phosphodiesterase family protein [Mycolicibacterium pulveris]MCV6982079.1 glycerophosphodiester phosphodiesterase family protein [Mycolicibacterium pulveris]BBY78880.1 hypothetical protein MPUL_00380 [Mycolicibacterium pulveris]